jgi:hypothetical protein
MDRDYASSSNSSDAESSEGEIEFGNAPFIAPKTETVKMETKPVQMSTDMFGIIYTPMTFPVHNLESPKLSQVESSSDEEYSTFDIEATDFPTATVTTNAVGKRSDGCDDDDDEFDVDAVAFEPSVRPESFSAPSHGSCFDYELPPPPPLAPLQPALAAVLSSGAETLRRLVTESTTAVNAAPVESNDRRSGFGGCEALCDAFGSGIMETDGAGFAGKRSLPSFPKKSNMPFCD